MKIIGFENKKLFLLDQRKLPDKISYLKIKDSKGTASAIRNMVVRGAPAIGITAAYGYCLGSIEKKFKEHSDLVKYIKNVKKELLSTRPTAVNLKWALDRMESEFNNIKNVDQKKIFVLLEEAANKIKSSEIEANTKIGEYGADILQNIAKKKKKLCVLTHCNAGELATGGWGTALGVIRSAFKKDLIDTVFVDETRPRFQGARLTCFELKNERIPHRLICDNMAGLLMSKGRVDVVIVGADRIVQNGDVANKIGTYMVAVLANRHDIPFYVAAPKSTFDMDVKEGSDIDIEVRSETEVLYIGGHRISPKGTIAMNPAFDVTPHELVTGYITENGVIKQKA
ncbi:S-methyl-5-thioribose-1-phosphate isomerase [Elusimicrobiota bacterium]